MALPRRVPSSVGVQPLRQKFPDILASLLMRSECKAQGELHEARRSQRRKILAELSRVVGQRGLSFAHIVTHGVGGVERLPAELQTPLLAQGKILAHPGVNLKHAVANN